MRDQLDRFGEINYTASLLEKVAKATSDTIVLNREDPLIFNIAKSLKDKNVKFFGLSQNLISTFPSDDVLHSHDAKSNKSQLADVILESFSDKSATFTVNNKNITTNLRLNGIYNIFNAAAALAYTRAIMGDKIDEPKLITALASVEPAFGRGERLSINGRSLELILVKNPSGFQLGLESFEPKGHATMIAINDNIADGRDMSWLWDVDFSSLANQGVSEVSGIRAYDMALRLQYDEVPVKNIKTNIVIALRQFIKSSGAKPMRIFCSYTAMISIRKYLSIITKVKVIK